MIKKCLKEKSQNPNESLHNIVWSWIPKRTFSGLDILNLGIFDAMLSYNDGYLSKIKVLEYLGLSAVRNTVEYIKRLDSESVRKAEKALEDLDKKIRQPRLLT